MIQTFLQLLEIIQLAINLYKKYGYEKSKSKLAKIIEEKNDEKTIDYIKRVIDE